jgi:hypothetical protein
MPPLDTRRDAPDLPVLDSCPVLFEEEMVAFVQAYYLHPDPDNPTRRFMFKSEKILTIVDGEPTSVEVATPVAVQWFTRACGTLAQLENTVEVKTCGVVPTSTPIFIEEPPPLRMAANR